VTLAWIMLLAACPSELAPDDLCREVGYAIAARTEECTGNTARAEARFLAFEEAYTCVEIEPDATTTADGIPVADLYACPLAIRNLACELANRHGDDLDAWMSASPACAYLVEAP
jgi:hypothetical protein